MSARLCWAPPTCRVHWWCGEEAIGKSGCNSKANPPGPRGNQAKGGDRVAGSVHCETVRTHTTKGSCSASAKLGFGEVAISCQIPVSPHRHLRGPDVDGLAGVNRPAGHGDGVFPGLAGVGHGHGDLVLAYGERDLVARRRSIRVRKVEPKHGAGGVRLRLHRDGCYVVGNRGRVGLGAGSERRVQIHRRSVRHQFERAQRRIDPARAAVVHAIGGDVDVAYAPGGNGAREEARPGVRPGAGATPVNGGIVQRLLVGADVQVPAIVAGRQFDMRG